MATNLEKLKAIAKPRTEKAVKAAQWRRENRRWLRMSQDIAIFIKFWLRKNDMSQKQLAEKMGVTPTYIGKLLKGNENLTLETISRLQEAINEDIMSIECYPQINNIVVVQSVHQSQEYNYTARPKCSFKYIA